MILSMGSVLTIWILGALLARQNLKVIKQNNARKFGAKRKELGFTNES